MKPYKGSDIKYRGFTIVNNKDYLTIYDSYGNYVKRIENDNHGSVTYCKVIIDRKIAKM